LPEGLDDIPEIYLFIGRTASFQEQFVVVGNDNFQRPDTVDTNSSWIVVVKVECEAIVLVMH